MKKNFKSLIAVVISLVVVLSVFTGCTGGKKADGSDAAGGAEVSTQQTDSGNQQTDSGNQQENSEQNTGDSQDSGEEYSEEDVVVYGESYSDVISVSAYIYEWEELPPNYITKNEAEKLGWQSSKGNLWDVAYGMSIGGDRFGNREGLLPEGEEYRECDIDYQGGYRGEQRLVYSIDDYDIYYTDDHYESFEQVYSYEDGYIWTE